jgi:hypothetical protein
MAEGKDVEAGTQTEPNIEKFPRGIICENDQLDIFRARTGIDRDEHRRANTG